MTAHRDPDQSKVMQVCLNGHLFTTAVCPACQAPVAAPTAQRVPGFCTHCDLPFPWVQRAFGEANRLYFDMGFRDKAFRVLEAATLHLMVQTPRSSMAASCTRDTLKAIDSRRWRLLRTILFEHACDDTRVVWEAR